MPLTPIAVDEIRWRIATERGGQLPAKVHRVAKPEVEALAAQGGMDVRGVAGEQHPALAIGRRLVGAIRPSRAKLEAARVTQAPETRRNTACTCSSVIGWIRWKAPPSNSTMAIVPGRA